MVVIELGGKILIDIICLMMFMVWFLFISGKIWVMVFGVILVRIIVIVWLCFLCR